MDVRSGRDPRRRRAVNDRRVSVSKWGDSIAGLAPFSGQCSRRSAHLAGRRQTAHRRRIRQGWRPIIRPSTVPHGQYSLVRVAMQQHRCFGRDLRFAIAQHYRKVRAHPGMVPAACGSKRGLRSNRGGSSSLIDASSVRFNQGTLAAYPLALKFLPAWNAHCLI
jgi:hypothetical protein